MEHDHDAAVRTRRRAVGVVGERGGGAVAGGGHGGALLRQRRERRLERRAELAPLHAELLVTDLRRRGGGLRRLGLERGP